MPNSADILTAVSLRLRDTSNSAYPVAMLNRLIDQCQRILNCNQRLVVKTVNFTTAGDSRVLYLTSAIATDIVRVDMVRQDGRNLFDIPWDSLMHQERTWLRCQGTRFDYFSRIGNDIVVIAPAIRVPTTVQIVYTSVTPAPTGATGDIPIPDEAVPMLQDIVEGVALLRSRKFTEASAPLSRVKALLTSMGNESMESQGGQS